MKRAVAFVLVVVLALSLVACSSDDQTSNIKSIVFNSNGYPVPDAEEIVYMDESNVYIFESMISNYVTVTYTDGSTEKVKDALANGHIQIADLDKYEIDYRAEPRLVETIIDRTENEHLPVGEALESFYRDENFLYYFPDQRCQYVIVHYKDGTEQNIKEAFRNDKITIAYLDWFGIKYEERLTSELPFDPSLLTSSFHRTLTLGALKELVRVHGENLTWRHFAGYICRQIGSGLFILDYPINDDYALWIGGSGPTEPPMYIYLISMKDHDNRIDVRTESIDAFLAGNESTADVPADFSFALTWNCYGVSSYDSETGKLIKTTDADNPDDYVTGYELQAWQRAYIYELISTLDANSYPDIYDPGNGLSEPSATLILTVRVNGAEKTIKAEHISLHYVSDNEKGQAFLDACTAISDLLTATKEWKALPDYENLYE